MSVSVTNLVQGPATMYVGAFGATEPADTAVNDTPAASVWTDVGGTQGGVKVTINQAYSALEVDQIVDVPGRRITSRDVTIETNLAEATLENLTLLLNDSVASSGSGFKSIEPVLTNSATQPTYRACLIDGFAPDSRRARIIVRKILNTTDVGTSYEKDNQTLFPAQFSAHYVSSTVAPFKAVYGTS